VSVQIERIGSIKKIGEYREFQLAVNGHPCIPMVISEPEWESYAARGEEWFWNRLAFLSLQYTRSELPHTAKEQEVLAGAMNEIAQRRA
jgi:hypothetical protein